MLETFSFAVSYKLESIDEAISTSVFFSQQGTRAKQSVASFYLSSSVRCSLGTPWSWILWPVSILSYLVKTRVSLTKRFFLYELDGTLYCLQFLQHTPLLLAIHASADIKIVY
jgi:hypothetical protein